MLKGALVTAGLALAALAPGCGQAGPKAFGPCHEVVDLAGRHVQVPLRVRRIACLEVLGYEKVFLLGQADKIAMMTNFRGPWMERANPVAAAIPRVDSPGMEAILAARMDAVFGYYDIGLLEKLTQLGVPSLVSQPPLPQGLDSAAYFRSLERSVRMFAQVLGGAAPARAEDWCAYAEQRVALVTGRSAHIPTRERLRAYYMRGPDANITQGRMTNTFCFGGMAGADMVVKGMGLSGRAEASLEEILRLDPQVIFVGRRYPASTITQDPRWRAVSAVKVARIIPLPEGVFYWDGGMEGILLMEFMAKTLYPTYFPDLDLAHEVKDYYRRFYGCTLSDAEAGFLLKGLSPSGAAITN
jgi:iron complex transport system substrate-binding protein